MLPCPFDVVTSLDGALQRISGRACKSIQVGHSVLKVSQYIIHNVNFPDDLLLGRPTKETYKIYQVCHERVVVVDNGIPSMRTPSTPSSQSSDTKKVRKVTITNTSPTDPYTNF